MRRALTRGGRPRRGPAEARRRGGRTAAQRARLHRTGKQSPGSGRDAPSVSPRPRFPSRPSPVASPGPWAGRTGGSRRHLPAAHRPHSALAGGDSEALGRHPPPRHLRPRVLREYAGPVGPGSPNFLLPPTSPPGPRSTRLGARPEASAHPPRAPGATAVARLLRSRAPLRPLQGPPPAASPPLATARRPPPCVGWRVCVT